VAQAESANEFGDDGDDVAIVGSYGSDKKADGRNKHGGLVAGEEDDEETFIVGRSAGVLLSCGVGADALNDAADSDDDSDNHANSTSVRHAESGVDDSERTFMALVCIFSLSVAWSARAAAFAFDLSTLFVSFCACMHCTQTLETCMIWMQTSQS
jgi:hypothetical protein